jgi:hypothetical protein
VTKRVVIDILRENFYKAIPLNRTIYTTRGIAEQYSCILDHTIFNMTHIRCDKTLFIYIKT